MIQKYIGRMISVPTGKIKALWAKAKQKLIKMLGGYVYPPVPPKFKAERVDTVKLSASMMVNKDRYSKERAYRDYIRSELSYILAGHMVDEGLMPSEKMIDFNDIESVVKVSVMLVKGGQ